MGIALTMVKFLREVWRELSDDEVRIIGRMDSKILESHRVNTGVGN